jgi:hypothetical protein
MNYNNNNNNNNAKHDLDEVNEIDIDQSNLQILHLDDYPVPSFLPNDCNYLEYEQSKNQFGGSSQENNNTEDENLENPVKDSQENDETDDESKSSEDEENILEQNLKNAEHPEDFVNDEQLLDGVHLENDEINSDSDMENIDNFSEDDEPKPNLDIDQLFVDAEKDNEIYEIEEIRLKSEDERIYSDKEEIDDMIKEEIEKLHPKLRNNPLKIEELRKKVERLNDLKLQYTRNIDGEPNGLLEINNSKPLAKKYSDYLFIKHWLKPIIVNKNKLYSLDEIIETEIFKSYFMVGQEKESAEIDTIKDQYDNMKTTFLDYITTINKIQNPYMISPSVDENDIPIGHIFNAVQPFLGQRFCSDPTYKCYGIHNEEQIQILTNTNRVLSPEFIYTERKLERGHGSKNDQVINYKAVLIQGEETNLNGLIKYPQKIIENYDMYDGVYTLDYIVKKSKKRPIILNNLYKKMIETGDFKTRYIDNNNLEVGKHVLITKNDYKYYPVLDGNNSFRTIDIRGIISKLNRAENTIILELPEDPNEEEILHYDNGNSQIEMSINDVTTNIETNSSKHIKDELSNKNNKISILYPSIDEPDQNILSLENYKEFMDNCIPDISSLLLNKETTNTSNFLLNLSMIDKIYYTYNLDFNKLEKGPFDIVKEIIANNISILTSVKQSTENIYKDLLKIKKATRHDLRRKIMRKDFLISNNKIDQLQEIETSEYKYKGNLYDSDSLRQEWIECHIDNGMYYINSLLIESSKSKNKKGSLEKTLAKIELELKKLKKEYATESQKAALFQKDEQCNQYKLVKIYENRQDVNNDKGTIMYDPNFDDTPLYILSELKQKHPELVNDIQQFKPLIISELRKLYTGGLDTDSKVLDKVTENIINGGREVNIGDYALLRTEKSFDIFKRVKLKSDGTELWKLEDQSVYQKIIRYNKDLCEQNINNLDNIELPDYSDEQCLFNNKDKDEFFDNLNKSVQYDIGERSGKRKGKKFKINIKDIGSCRPRKLNNLEIEIQKLFDSKLSHQNLLNSLEHENDIFSYIKQNLSRKQHLIELNRKYIEKKTNIMLKNKTELEKQITSKSNNCPHDKLIEKAYKTDNFSERVSLLIKTYQKYQKGYHSHGENEHYIYCNKCDQKIFCQHELEIFNIDTSIENPDIFNKELLIEYGVLDDSGIVCKYCGVLLKKREDDDFEGFQGDGRLIKTREELEEENDEDKITIESLFQNAKNIKIGYEILNIIDTFLGVTRLYDVFTPVEKIYLAKEILNNSVINNSDNENYLRYISKDSVKLQNYTSSQFIIITIATLFINIQAKSNKVIQLRYIYPGCIGSLIGFPLDDEDKSMNNYFACILTHLIKKSNEPWVFILEYLTDYLSYIKNKSQKGDKRVKYSQKQIKGILDKQINHDINSFLKKLSSNIKYKELLQNKRIYLAELGQLLSHESKWSNFLPPLDTESAPHFVLTLDIQNLNEQYINLKKNKLPIDLLKTILQETNKELNSLSYDIIFKLNELIAVQDITTPLFGISMLTTSCCISQIKGNFNYFDFFEDESISQKLNLISEVQELFKKLNITDYSGLLHCSDMNMEHYSVENTYPYIYPSVINKSLLNDFFMKYCNTGYSKGDKHIFDKHDRCVLCFKTKFEINENVKSVVEGYDEQGFTDLIQIIANKNIVHKDFNMSIMPFIDTEGDEGILNILVNDQTSFQTILASLAGNYMQLFESIPEKSLDNIQIEAQVTDIWEKFTIEISGIDDKLRESLERINDDRLKIDELYNFIVNIDHLMEVNTHKQILIYKDFIIPLIRYQFAKIRNSNTVDTSKLSESEWAKNLKFPGNKQDLESILSPLQEYIIIENKKIEQFFPLNPGDENIQQLGNKNYIILLDNVLNILESNFKYISYICGKLKDLFFTQEYAYYLIVLIFKSTINEILSLPQKLFSIEDTLAMGPDQDTLDTIQNMKFASEIIFKIIDIIFRNLRKNIEKMDFNKVIRNEELEKKREREKEKLLHDIDNLKKKHDEYQVWEAMKNIGLKSLYREFDDFEEEKQKYEEDEAGLVVDKEENEALDLSKVGGEDDDPEI